MPYTCPPTQAATVMIRSYVELKAEHAALGKSRANQEQLLKLTRDLDAKGTKISAVLARLVADARSEYDRMVAVIDRLLEQALVTHGQAKAALAAAAQADPLAVLKKAREFAQAAEALREQAVAEDKACNDAILEVNRSFNPHGLDEKYAKAFFVARLGLHAESKRTSAKLEKLALLAKLCKALQAQAADAVTARQADDEARKSLAEVTAKLARMLEATDKDAGNAEKKLVIIRQAAAAKRISAKDAAMCLASLRECEGYHQSALGRHELAQTIYEQAVRRYPGDAGAVAAERRALASRMEQWPRVMVRLKQTFDHGAKAMIDIRKRAQA